SIVGQGTKGTASVASGKLHYVPDANKNGADSFTYRASDGVLNSNTATVSVTINPVNDAPAATAHTLTTDEDTAKTVTLSGSDIDGDSLSFKITSLPSHGALYDGADTSGHHIVGGLGGDLPYTLSGNQVTYVPAANYNGADSFQFKANDGTVDSATA